MRRMAAIASTTAAAALAALLAFSTPAAAGGPTSVLVVSPHSGETAALYATSDRYTRLERLLGEPVETSAAGPRESEGPVNAGAGRQINATWMIHDVSVWRVDRIYPDAEAGKVWIRTASSHGDARQRPDVEKGYWHMAEKPAELTALLGDLGVMSPRKGGLGSVDHPPDIPPLSGTSSSASAGAADWWWNASGFAAGICMGCGGTMLMRRWLSRRSLDEPGPRHELLDV
jgi:hypothetical protein